MTDDNIGINLFGLKTLVDACLNGQNGASIERGGGSNSRRFVSMANGPRNLEVYVSERGGHPRTAGHVNVYSQDNSVLVDAEWHFQTEFRQLRDDLSDLLTVNVQYDYNHD